VSLKKEGGFGRDWTLEGKKNFFNFKLPWLLNFYNLEERRREAQLLVSSLLPSIRPKFLGLFLVSDTFSLFSLVWGPHFGPGSPGPPNLGGFSPQAFFFQSLPLKELLFW